jgi:TPR repeat protein
VAAGVIAVALIAAGALFLYRGPRAPEPALASGNPSDREIPPALRQYYEQAHTGDARAMRMLGTLYYNGLNVPQDRDEGIRWYRKAAAAGSVAARKDLEQLGLAPEQ